MKKILMATTYQQKKENTKTVWINFIVETEVINEEEYSNITNVKTQKWFRNLGGIETAVKGHTAQGYQIIELRSTSPDRQVRIIRIFKFL